MKPCEDDKTFNGSALECTLRRKEDSLSKKTPDLTLHSLFLYYNLSGDYLQIIQKKNNKNPQLCQPNTVFTPTKRAKTRNQRGPPQSTSVRLRAESHSPEPQIDPLQLREEQTKVRAASLDPVLVKPAEAFGEVPAQRDGEDVEEGEQSEGVEQHHRVLQEGQSVVP